jgi:hypothetical protein
MSGIVGRQVETGDPWGGLPPRVHNVPAQWVGFPVASATNNVYTTANHFTSTQTAGTSYSMAPGTNLDYARNVQVMFVPNTASAGLYSKGTLLLYGVGYYGATISESKAISDIASVSTPWQGSVNFQNLKTISISGLQFHSASSSARSDVTFRVGMGAKIGLPVYFQSSDGAVMHAYIGTAYQSTVTATASTSNNQYTVVTGPYSVGGVSFSNALGSGSALQIHYKMNGRSVPYEIGRHE